MVPVFAAGMNFYGYHEVKVVYVLAARAIFFMKSRWCLCLL